MNYQIQLQGLHCESCKKITEKRIGKLEGVTSVNVDISQQTALVRSERALNQTEVEEALKDTAYKITALTEV
ncbi:MAG: hypothetical protein CO141_01220 [Candidatus Moranbacteria bacterium CG_4_9_14_3_um_filter_42_9]|nr:MAG: hypothetical protein CO141_01220 [Candidatus Moranbacteria bacterium CG_4_9_14_3_um_filter_42_9]